MTAITPTGPVAVYTGRATNWPMVAVCAALGALLVLYGGGNGGFWWGIALPAAFVLAGVGLYVLTGSSVRTTAGTNGVTVRFGAFGWPRCHYPLATIARAEVIDLNPLFVAFGFWWTPRRTCCTVRSGPTLRLHLRTGRTVTVTVPDPAAAVQAIERAAGV